MLKIVNSMKELNFAQLMDVYRETNLGNAATDYRRECPEQGLIEAERDFYQYLQECFFAVPGAVYALWIEQECIVSALRMEPYQDGWLLESLETILEHRRKGYAENLVEAVLKWANENHRLPVYSHISRNNKGSLRVHQKCGFKKILDHVLYIDGSVSWTAVTMKYSEGEDSCEPNPNRKRW